MNAHADSTDPSPLDLFATPLTGVSLVEASAGTGKTYAIAGLYLRLIVEVGLRIDEILVVTYTKAATAELKERLQRRLLEVRAALRQEASDDDYCRQLIARCPDRSLALRRVNNALLAFDEASVYTIHGFCQRVLSECAFESGAPFEAELNADADAVLLEIVEDFWRRQLHDARPLLAGHVVAKQLSPEGLLAVIKPLVSKPYLKVMALSEITALGSAEATFIAAFEKARGLWQEERDAIVALLTGSDLSKKSYNDKLPQYCEGMDEYLGQEEIDRFRVCEKFELFTTAKLRSSVNKNGKLPEHPFFNACDELLSAAHHLEQFCQRFFQWLYVELLQYCRIELPTRKRRRQLQSYDDLLLNLHRALHTPEAGALLAERLRQRYRAALIDEFQDTDPIQYDIFRAIYSGTEQPLFMVGDPKQAIYSFRGADIFAYLKARRDAAYAYTLDTNWRSEPRLITAVNTLFSRHPHPFLLEEIPFYPVRPAKRPRQRLVIVPETGAGDDETASAPLQFWYFEGGEKGSYNKEDATELVARATANHIAELLILAQQGKAYLAAGEDKIPLHGGHIAVLVRKHTQAVAVYKALLAVGVPAILQSRDSVFATREADELERILLAIAAPRLEERLRAALLTDLMGYSAVALDALMGQERAWERLLANFDRYHQLWREHGFVRLFRVLLADCDGYRRLLRFRDGERRLTNWLHLAELLQEISVQRQLSIEGLVDWLIAQRQQPTLDEESRQLRLESDAQRVEIVTIHKSKGLEYPLVYCPFLWDAQLITDKEEPLSYHDPAQHYRAVVDLGSEQRGVALAQARYEALAEELRLTYVAITRAQLRCYIAWGRSGAMAHSALGWLLYRPPVVAPQDDWLAAQQAFLKVQNDQSLKGGLEALAAAAPGAIAVTPLPMGQGLYYHPSNADKRALTARQFKRRVPCGWRFTSFSQLQERRGVSVADYDADSMASWAEASVGEGDALTAFHFPRGAKAGRCLHAIFERLMADPHSDVLADIEAALVQFDLPGYWRGTVAEMVAATLDATLDPGVQLRQVRGASLVEMSFAYPLERWRARELIALLGRWGERWEARLQRLDFELIKGFMRGYIDLVFEAEGRFYLVDYKSNWLGPQLEDYQPDALEAAMTSGGYHLQYLIYIIALYRFLRWRLPGFDYERHFGGVRYLFLRGLRPDDPKSGIYAAKPPRELVEALDDFIQRGQA